VLGQVNHQSHTTTIQMDAASGAPALHVGSSGGGAIQGDDPSGIGVLGTSSQSVGVYGASILNTGARGQSESGFGVAASSDSNWAVYAWSNSGNGVLGHRASTTGGGAGVQGFSGVSPSPSSLQVGVRGVGAEIGVLGESVVGGEGVEGRSIGGPGVKGHSFGGDGVVPGVGVLGISSGEGVRGVSDVASGAGVVAENVAGGTGLRVIGRARFSTAGTGTLPAGTESIFVSDPGVTADSHVSVTLTSNPGLRTVHWIELGPGSGFTVHLTPIPARLPHPATTFTFLVIEHD
jgi:hypothetical protein